MRLVSGLKLCVVLRFGRCFTGSMTHTAAEQCGCCLLTFHNYYSYYSKWRSILYVVTKNMYPEMQHLSISTGSGWAMNQHFSSCDTFGRAAAHESGEVSQTNHLRIPVSYLASNRTNHKPTLVPTIKHQDTMECSSPVCDPESNLSHHADLCEQRGWIFGRRRVLDEALSWVNKNQWATDDLSIFWSYFLGWLRNWHASTTLSACCFSKAMGFVVRKNPRFTFWGVCREWQNMADLFAKIFWISTWYAMF